MKHFLSLIAVSLLLASCSSPYGPLGHHGGYMNMKVGPNTHKVAFMANGMTNAGDCERKALYRCAELAIIDGCSYFEVLKGGTGIKMDVMILPAQTTVNTTSYGAAYGASNTMGYMTGNSYFGNTYGGAAAVGNSYTTITSTPPTPVAIPKPQSMYLIRTTNKNSPGCYDAKALATEAHSKGFRLDPRVTAALGAKG